MLSPRNSDRPNKLRRAEHRILSRDFQAGRPIRCGIGFTLVFTDRHMRRKSRRIDGFSDQFIKKGNLLDDVSSCAGADFQTAVLVNTSAFQFTTPHSTSWQSCLGRRDSFARHQDTTADIMSASDGLAIFNASKAGGNVTASIGAKGGIGTTVLNSTSEPGAHHGSHAVPRRSSIKHAPMHCSTSWIQAKANLPSNPASTLRPGSAQGGRSPMH